MKRIYLIMIICLLSINGWTQKDTNQSVRKDSIHNESLTLSTPIEELNYKVQIIENKLNDKTEGITSGKSKGIFTMSNFYFSIFLLSASLLLSIIVVCVFYLLYRNEWSRDKIIEEVLNSTRIKQLVAGQLQLYKPNAQTPNIDSIVRQVIEQLKKEQSYHTMANLLIQETNESNKQLVTTTPILAQPNLPPQSKYFYSIEPRSGGNFFFVDKTTTSFEETESVYHFEKQNEYSAQFRVIDDLPTMKRAISYKAELLDIACDSINGSQNTQKIITEKPGNVKKEGDKWVIVAKAKIKFV